MKIPMAKPGTTTENKTGDWATQHPQLDKSKCIKCGICYNYCPDSVIEWDKGEHPEFDYNFCKGCGVCANECPMKALTMRVVEKCKL
ncbi:MAG: 4Fe-4S binding protein [Candidatus Micrarchaeota archaeon]